jgi:MinD superfamily P-loop ATPase
MRIAVVSGKGGTGKTTIAVSIGELEKGSTKVDGDVEASNLYLYYDSKNKNMGDFSGSSIAVVDPDICIQCGKCDDVCRFDAIESGKVDELKCEGCGACTLVCPKDAIKLEDEKTAEMYITETSNGVISRAEMEIGGDGSGLLITELRKNAVKYEEESKFVIIDGSPGIGCSVIASITGNDVAIIVTEPTKTGMEDFIRVNELTNHFNIPAFVCINKYDINEEIALEIENYCKDEGIPVVGKIPYDETIIKSINELKPIIYYEDSKANHAIREMWENVKQNIKNLKESGD